MTLGTPLEKKWCNFGLKRDIGMQQESSCFTLLNDAKGNHVTTPEAMPLPEVLLTVVILH